LLTTDDHVPVIAGVFVEDVDKTGAVSPEQIAGIEAKVGVMLELTVTDKVVVVAHCPDVGVNVYVPDAVLLTTDDHVPVIAGVFVDDVDKTGAVSPEQIAGIEAKVGVTFELTVTDKVVVVAHCPEVGVNVYVPLAVLLTADDHVPVIAGVFVDDVDKTGAVSPEQIAGIEAKVGVTFELTVTVKVVVVAHCPEVGVNVYVPLAVLLTADDHVPVIAGVFVDDVDKIGAVSPEQIAGIEAKVGVTFELTVTDKVVVVAHCPDVGVNVYVPDAVLLTTDDQVPVIAGVFVEDVDKTGAVSPEQIAGIEAKVGVTFELTVTVKVVVVAHCPDVGVNV